MNEERKYCPGKHTNCVGSPYSKDQVPVSLFRQNPDNPESKICKECFHCRKYKNASIQKNKEKNIKKHEETKKLALEGKVDVLHCSSCLHEKSSGSPYPRDKVPLDLFRKIPGNPNSFLYDKCKNCRDYVTQRHTRYEEIRKEETIGQGKNRCGRCRCIIDEKNRGRRKDGEYAACCVACTERSHERIKEHREDLNSLKMEFVDFFECSCFNCKRIFLRPDKNSLKITTLETYLDSQGIRCVILEGISYPARHILEMCKDDLELSIIEFDHLTESEQRERGFLNDDEIFVDKETEVTTYKSSYRMKLESYKCQHLCMICHTIQSEMRTVRSDKGPTKLKMKKRDFVNKLKLSGCESCGYQNEQYPQCLDMDHLHPEYKIETVSHIVNFDKFSFKDLIEECKKCRILCKFCHKIHTINQIKEGILGY